MRNVHDEPVGHPLRGPAFGERTDPASLSIGTVLTGLGAGASVLGAIGGMGGSKSVAPAPPIAKPPVMPIPDDAAVKAAQRRSLADQAQRRGRQSTILSDTTTNDPLGG